MKTRAQLFALLTVTVLAVSAAVSGQGARDARDMTAPPRSSGFLVQRRDGTLLLATAARISQKAGKVDKVGSFLLGLGGAAPDFESAALGLMRFTPRGALDAGFGNNGVVVTPLLPLRNRNQATVTACLQDSAGRLIVVGYRDTSTFLDANFDVILAARYTVRIGEHRFGRRPLRTGLGARSERQRGDDDRRLQDSIAPP